MWRWYVWSAIALTVLFGFGLGAGLFGYLALDHRASAWWIAAGQAHGHNQMIGWLGLIIVGVGLHFLPRLGGANAISNRSQLAALVLLGFGLIVRGFCQPILAGSSQSPGMLRAMILLASLAELAGAAIAVSALVTKLRVRTKRHANTGIRSLAPVLALAVAGLFGALILGVWGTLDLIIRNAVLVEEDISGASIELALFAFVIPIGIAMSIRLFPLYLRTKKRSPNFLLAASGFLGCGAVGSVVSKLTSPPGGSSAAYILLSLGLVTGTAATGVFGSRRSLPRYSPSSATDPLQLHALAAYAWLMLGVAFMALLALDEAELRNTGISDVALWHVVGFGFATILIFGVGQVLLPGFAGRRPGSKSWLWATLIAGNLAALLRVAPVTTTRIEPWTDTLIALSGSFGVVAVLAFSASVFGPELSIRGTPATD